MKTRRSNWFRGRYAVVLATMLGLTLAACGGGGEESRPAKSSQPLGQGSNDQGGGRTQPVWGGYEPQNRESYDSAGSELIKKLRDGCPELHNSTQKLAVACVAGTYNGQNPVTGESCSTVITAGRDISFRMGAEQLRSFNLSEDILYHKDKASNQLWTLVVRGNNREPFILKWRRVHFELRVDTRTGDYIDITLKNTDPNIGADMDTTCRTYL